MSITPEEYASLSLEEAARGLADGAYTAGELLAAAQARMNAFEPAVNAVVTRDDEAARRRAAEIDAAGKPPPGSPLWGVPMGVKDNLMTRGLRSTCGASILANFVPPYDAAVVEKIRAAGAVVAAKTNMDAFAMGSTGENSAFGPTHNPWDLTRVPGGSSSGSAAMVAYGGAPAALASDTGGSIRQPSSFCGLVGMKPTYGRVSRHGAAALASSLDQVGAITRTVRDNALLMDVLTGRDPRDSTSAPQADSAASCLATVENGVKGLRIGVDPTIVDREGMDPDHARALGLAAELAREGGADIKEVKIPHIDYGVPAYYIICTCEASANMARFDGVHYGVRRGSGDLWDVYAETRGVGFNDEVKRRIMMGSYALSKGYYDAYYLKAARVRRLFTDEFAELFKSVDVILMPVAPQAPRKLGAAATPLENYLGDVFTLSANLTGVPALAFPTGVAEGLPVGVQALASPFREDILYRVARTVEKSTRLDGAPWTRPLPEGVK